MGKGTRVCACAGAAWDAKDGRRVGGVEVPAEDTLVEALHICIYIYIYIYIYIEIYIWYAAKIMVAVMRPLFCLSFLIVFQ